MNRKSQILFSQKLETDKQKYTFTIEESEEGKHYLVISSSPRKKRKTEDNNRIVIDLSHLEHFEDVLSKAINFFIEKGESRVNRIMRIRQKYKNAYAKWTKEDDLRLKNGYLKGKTIEQLAEILYRKPSAIRIRLRKLNILFYG